MIDTLIRQIKGIISIVLYMISLFFWGMLPILCSVLYLFFPTKKMRNFIRCRIMQKAFVGFMFTNRCIMAISTRGKWDVQGCALKKNGWYLIISNHLSWIDILALGKIFNLKIPPIVFFIKKELLWQLPIAGLTCYVLGFPFMSRHSHEAIRKNPALKNKDVMTAKKACRQLRSYPVTLLNFAEGTRFTEQKRDRQQSPYQNLLKPRAGGISMVIQELQPVLDGMINTVIHYAGKQPTLWDFACGNVEKIMVRYECLPVQAELIGDYENNREFRTQFQRWLNALWKRNDEKIEQLKKLHEK